MKTQRTGKKKAPAVKRDHALHLLRGMIRIRRLEEKCAELYGAMKIRGFRHLYDGEEAVAVGVLEALNGEVGREAIESEVARVAILMGGGPAMV